MKKTFHSKAGSFHFYVCLVLLAVIVGIHLVNVLANRNSLPRRPETVVLEKPATLRGRIDDEKFEIKIRKGQEIKILGGYKGLMTTPERLWVELQDGSRGYIYCTDFDLEYKAQVSKKGRLEKVKVNGYDGSKMVCELEDGTVKEIYCDDVYPEWPREWKFDYLSTSTYSAYISKDKFERKYLGSTFEKNDKRMLPARCVISKNGSTYASYPMWILDTSSGMRYAPTVVYDVSGEAKSYVHESSKKRAKLFLKIWPLVGPIVDNPVCNSLIQGSMYNVLPEMKGEPSFIRKAIGFVVLLIYLVFVILWLYATPMVLVLLIGVLMHNPKIFYPLSNKTLNVIMLSVTVISAYVWTALLIGWGIMWLFLLPLPLAVMFIYGLASGPLAAEAPCRRCLSCRNIESMVFVDTVYDHEYLQWMRKSEYVKKLGEKTRKWTTWTDVTTRYSDGRTVHTKENVQDHSETITTSLFDDYNVLYDVTVYRNNYECCVCGQHEHNFSEKYEEKERRYLGNHTETSIS